RSSKPDDAARSTRHGQGPFRARGALGLRSAAEFLTAQIAVLGSLVNRSTWLLEADRAMATTMERPDPAPVHPRPKRKAPWPVEFYRSAVGKKWVMALSG